MNFSLLVIFCSRWVTWRVNTCNKRVDTSHKPYSHSWYFTQIADDHYRLCTLQKSLRFHEPAKFRLLGALSAQLSMSAWMWDLCCFLTVIVSFLRLRGFAKERGRHPRWSCAGVTARWGNPGQEGRSQGRRANERVSGETLFLFLPCHFILFFLMISHLSFLSPYYPTHSLSVFFFVYLRGFVFW